MKLFGYSPYNFSHEPKPVLILEYMKNGSLDELLHNGQLKIDRSIKYIILLGTAFGMKYLHSHGIVHRDLKPANILLDDRLYPKICDFGCSYISDEKLSKIQMDEFIGTAIYMAPEIYSEEKKRYTFKVDVYSFSLFIYEILTGIIPFNDYKTKYKLMRDKNKGLIPDCSMIKDEIIVSFLKQCWSLNPSERSTFDDIVSFIFSERIQQALRVRIETIISYLDLIY